MSSLVLKEGSDLKLLIGLGNPGKAYTHTRHNLGFLVVEEVARRKALSWKQSSLYKAVVATGTIRGNKTCLFLPQTMMNNSGAAVAKVIWDKGVKHSGILVVCDDLNLDFGQLRVRPEGSDGGHNGLKSIIAHLGGGKFNRLRLGISRPPQGVDAADYVLAEFTRVEKRNLKDFIQEAADCCEAWISEGIEKVMNVFNKRKGNE